MVKSRDSSVESHTIRKLTAVDFGRRTVLFFLLPWSFLRKCDRLRRVDACTLLVT